MLATHSVHTNVTVCVCVCVCALQRDIMGETMGFEAWREDFSSKILRLLVCIFIRRSASSLFEIILKISSSSKFSSI